MLCHGSRGGGSEFLVPRNKDKNRPLGEAVAVSETDFTPTDDHNYLPALRQAQEAR
jgi:hypothetical protein